MTILETAIRQQSDQLAELARVIGKLEAERDTWKQRYTLASEVIRRNSLEVNYAEEVQFGVADKALA